MGLWQNSTPFFGAAALCTTEIDGFRASVTLTYMATSEWGEEMHLEERTRPELTQSKLCLLY